MTKDANSQDCSGDKNRISVATFNRRARQYQDKYMDISPYHESLNAFIEGLKTKAKLAELGCGPGNVTRYLLNKNAQLTITASDLSPNMVALGKQNCPEAEFKVMDCRNLNDLEGAFDGFVCGFVLPYLSEDEAGSMFEQVYNKLNSGGLLYISTMENDYQASCMQESATTGDKVFIYYYQAETLKTKLQSCGFVITEVRKVVAFEGADTDLVIIARKS